MLVKNVPYDDDVRKAVWPSFKVSIEEKHGKSGATGARGENNALKLFETDFDFNLCLNHAEDVLGQLQGIDFTCYSKNIGFVTIDVKSGGSSLYWNREKKYWYITIKEDFFDKRKLSTHIMHIGPKGDLYAYYEKDKMVDFLASNAKNVLIKNTYGYILKLENFPEFVQHNIRMY